MDEQDDHHSYDDEDDEDDEDEDDAAIEMAPRGHSALATTTLDDADDFVDEDVVLDDNETHGGGEPFAWAERQMRRQNRCFFLALAALVIGAAVFYVVGDVYYNTTEEGALEGDKYNAESGILNEEFDGAKAQDVYEEEHENENNDKPVNVHGWFASHGRDNPFGNKNAKEHGNSEALEQLRWEKAHPGQPFPVDKMKGLDGTKGHHGSGPGGIKGGGHKGSGGGGGGGLRPGGNTRPNGGNQPNPGRPNGGGGGAGDPGWPNNGAGAGGNENGGGQGEEEESSSPSSSQCDHSEYSEWLDATVTLNDGVKYEIVEKFDHDHKAFVQGLTYAHDTLWESNGLYGRSTIRILDPDTAAVIKSVDMSKELFGEGMAYWQGKLYQITWKSQRGFIYNATTLETIDEFKFHTTRNEGWGITWDPCEREFVVTDGSPNLHFWEKETLAQKRTIPVTRMDGSPAHELNEIEWFRGKILANVWFEDVLLVIDPTTGTVEKEYDFSNLFPKSLRDKLGCDVLNGISVSKDPDILYVTGKKWDRMFKVRLLS